jgi:hypothetical protein
VRTPYHNPVMSPLQEAVESILSQGRQVLDAGAKLLAVVQLWAGRSSGSEAAALQIWTTVISRYNRQAYLLLCWLRMLHTGIYLLRETCFC